MKQIFTIWNNTTINSSSQNKPKVMSNSLKISDDSLE